MKKSLIRNLEFEDLILEIKEFFSLTKKDLKIEKDCVIINYNQLIKFAPRTYESLLVKPEETINFMEEALNSVILQEKRIRFEEIDKHSKKEIRKIRVDDLDKFFSFKGIIKRVTKVIPRVVSIKFECPSCGNVISVIQSKKKIQEPKKCSCGRTKYFKNFLEERKNIQELNLEEIPEELDGKQPQQLRVYLEGDLTDNSFSKRLQPGKKIEIIGTIKTLPAFMTLKDEESNLSEFMIEANNIINLDEDDEINLTKEDIKQIEEISVDNPLEKLSNSLAPEVYGNNEIKEAIILQLVKGVSKERTDGSFSREDIHILLSGDPGIAKSTLLKAVVLRTPKARMVVGTKTSRVGLGAMAVKDELTNSWSLECGNLVLSSGSILCLDEMDKMYKENLSELLEPMSSGTITIAKAGINAKLPARTSILASANPIQGSFELDKDLSRQVDLPSPIMNRFDLIFIMIDRPDEDFDSKSIRHVFEAHTEKKQAEISLDLFKKCIFYFRKQKPKLKKDLIEHLEKFYIDLRKKSKIGDIKGMPINLRNMEGLIRLAEANSKIRLSKYVELEDLDVAKEIFLFCLRQIGIDNETGLIDMSRITEKVPTSKRGKLESLLNLIEDLSQENDNLVPYKKIIEEAQKLDIRVWESKNFIEQLKKEGQIFEPKQGVFSLIN